MKIKLHNSLGKISGYRCLFDNKVYSYLGLNNIIYLNYKIDDLNFFINFSIKTKEFVKLHGFGRKEKEYSSDWWKDFKWNWKEVGK